MCIVSAVILLSSMTSLLSANDCIYQLFNSQSRISAQNYIEPNTRGLDEYIDSFGSELKHGLKNGHTVIDVGSGYGLSVLDLIRQNKVKGIAINIQDNYSFLTNLNKFSRQEWDSKLVIQFNQDKTRVRFKKFDGISADVLSQIAKKVGFDPTDLMVTKELSPLVAAAFYQKQILNLSQKIKDYQKTGKFVYEVGYAEKVLPHYKGQAERVMDFWGAYAYSPARVELLQSYYNALTPSGRAYVLIPSQARSGFVYNDDLLSFKLILEDYLVSRYPTVFKKVKTLSKNKSFSDLSVLQISRDARIPDLNLDYIKLNKIINEHATKTSTFAPPIIELKIIN